MKKSKHIYSYPLYYEIAFCGGDIRREINFILRCYQRHHENAALSSILDNGCGTARYLEEFAKRGIEVCGYDLSPQMVDYSKARLAQAGARAHLFRADLRDFTTPHGYDMAICMNGSFQYLMTLEDVVHHLRCVAGALRDQGLYLISLPSPEGFFLNPPGSLSSQWSETRDGVTVWVDFTYRQHPFEWPTQTFSGLAKIEVDDHDQRLYLEMPYRYRIFLPWEIEALVQLSGGFEIAHIYGDFHLGRTYGKTREPEYMNVLLRRIAG